MLAKIEDHDIDIDGDVTTDKSDGSGYINLTVTVVATGKRVHVGGAYFAVGGTVYPYQWRDAGDIEGLTDELGWDAEDAGTLMGVLRDLHTAADPLYQAAADDIDAIAPTCSHPDGHRWEAHPGEGCAENPGVYAIGGAAIRIHEYCLHCGAARIRVVGDVDECGNRNGVTYSAEALTGDALADLRDHYGCADE